MVNNPLHTSKNGGGDGERKRDSLLKSPKRKSSPAGVLLSTESVAQPYLEGLLGGQANQVPELHLDAAGGAAEASAAASVAAGSAAGASNLPGNVDSPSAGAAAPEEPPKPLTTDKVSAKEWGLLRRASLRSAEFGDKLVAEDGKLSIPKGWKKLMDGKGYVRGLDGLVVGHLNEVLEMEMQGSEAAQGGGRQ